MAGSQHTVKCAQCKCALEEQAGSDPLRAACPLCGVGDTVEVIEREVGWYIEDQVGSVLTKTMVDAFQNKGPFEVTGDFKPRGGYRFIVDLDVGAAFA